MLSCLVELANMDAFESGFDCHPYGPLNQFFSLPLCPDLFIMIVNVLLHVTLSTIIFKYMIARFSCCNLEFLLETNISEKFISNVSGILSPCIIK